jgi:hypothetical protein
MDWISHGYNVKPLEEVIEKDIETIRRTFNSFEWAIEELKAYETILNDLEVRGFVKEVVDLRSNIMNVDSLPLIRSRMSALRERLGPDVVPIATVTTHTVQEVAGPKVPTAATKAIPQVSAASQATDQEPLKAGKAGEPGALMLANLLDRIRSLRRTEGLQAVEGVERLREEGPLGPTAVPMATGPRTGAGKEKVARGEVEEEEWEGEGEEPEEKERKTEGGGEVSQKKKVKKKVKKKIKGGDDRGQ